MTFIDGAAPPETELVKDGSDQGFMADVIEASRAAPVIVDFWAPWCGPCKTLGPPLEKAVRKAGGKVRLVKINIDENPGVAGQLGVKSIPAVYAFDQGRPIDGFMGAIPESQIKLFVDRLAGADMTAEIEPLLEQAADSLKLGDIGGAAQGYTAVLQLDPENVKAIAGMARIALSQGDAEQTQEILAHVPPEKANDPEVLSVKAALDLAAKAEAVGDNDELGAQVAANPTDWRARYDYAEALSARGDLEAASEELLTIIAKNRDWNEGAARTQLLKIFEAAGPTSEVAKQGRRKLSAILFS
ncbi:thioredoxin family protein [Terricaulis silvestris]|uniref:Thioredoxin n=1 Tax=Terricaulis silvestris TaxID=2686094 RepID=A0A6I6N168_9CAUL|nr:co-chaperone YbbN [Terricaulis silvestris]QGZ97073.1 Thioredoxin [Terricaulis silvestris]